MKTYGAYCKEITGKLSDMSKTVERVNVVSDIYKEMSLKQKTRKGRSKGNEAVF